MIALIGVAVLAMSAMSRSTMRTATSLGTDSVPQKPSSILNPIHKPQPWVLPFSDLAEFERISSVKDYDVELCMKRALATEKSDIRQTRALGCAIYGCLILENKTAVTDEEAAAATNYAEKAISLGDDTGLAQLVLGFCAVHRGDSGMAEPHLRSSLAKLKERPVFAVAAQHGLAAVAILKGEPDTAIGHLNEALGRHPQSDSDVYSLRALAYLAKEEVGKALVDCEDAIKLDPDAALAWWVRGHAKFALGQTADGLADCARAVQIDPSYHTDFEKLQDELLGK
jgi:tetratricopeptide (TPR) repeat protein